MTRIAHITDLHLDEKFPIDHGVKGEENLKRILDDVVAKGIKEVIFTGDIGSEASNKWFFDFIKKYNLNLKVTLGTHDVFSTAIKFYNPGLQKDREELFYSEEAEYFKFIFLDSSTEVMSDTQLNWFKNELNTTKKIIFFIHHPVLETNTTPQREFPLIGSEKIKTELLNTSNEVYIYCGHLHMEHEESEGNIMQFVTPASCFQIKKHSDTSEVDNINFGYRVLNIDKEEITSEVVMFEAL